MRRGIGGAVVVGVLGALVLAAPASAAADAEVIQGEHVRLVSVADWDRAAVMAPGESMRWDLEVSADAPEPGTLAIAMSAAGETPLIVDAALCLDEWQGETCPGGAEDLRTAWEIPATVSRSCSRNLTQQTSGTCACRSASSAILREMRPRCVCTLSARGRK